MKNVLCVYQHAFVGANHVKGGCAGDPHRVSCLFSMSPFWAMERTINGWSTLVRWKWWYVCFYWDGRQKLGKWFQLQILSHKVPSGERAGTCSSAHAPWRQAVGRGKAVEYADVLRRQELHKLGVCKDFPLAVQDGRCLVRDVNNLPRDKRDSHGKYILPIKK